MTNERPLILFTNDDGIGSPGFWAAVEAFSAWAGGLVVAPRVQQSGTGRSLPVTSKGRIYSEIRRLHDRDESDAGNAVAHHPHLAPQIGRAHV